MPTTLCKGTDTGTVQGQLKKSYLFGSNFCSQFPLFFMANKVVDQPKGIGK